MAIIYETKVGNTVIKIADDYIADKEESERIIKRVSAIASRALQAKMKTKTHLSESAPRV